MNLRWLIGNFADPQYRLPRKDQMRLSLIAHHRHLSTTRFLAWTMLFIILPFLLVMKFIYPHVMAWMGFNTHTSHYWWGWVIAIFVVFWPWSAWMYRMLYIRPMRLAMRESGFDLCIECGYELRGLPDDVKRCPECGGEREPIDAEPDR